MIKKLLSKNWAVFILYFALFALVLLSGINGIGNYWDWGFPYFRDHLQNSFQNDYLSWYETDFGRTLGYSSGYYFRYFLSLLRFIPLQTEILLYLLLTALFSISSLGAYLISKKYSKKSLSFLLGAVAVLNPAIFYKLLGGHLFYLASYAIFIYLIYYLLNCYKDDIKSAIVLGLLTAFVGIQIQLFPIAFITLIVFFLANKILFSYRSALIVILIVFLINLPWLSNFIVGSTSVVGTSRSALNGIFSDLNYADPIWIVLLLFSKATLIKYSYIKWVFPFFGIFSVIVFYLLHSFISYKERRKGVSWFLPTLILIFGFLMTGFFHKINIFPINILYPIFREVGHFAPPLMLFSILFIGYYLPKIRFKKEKIIHLLLSIYLIIFGVINIFTFIVMTPKVNYSDRRQDFYSFKSHIDKNQSDFRVLTYPFWSQYGFKDEKNNIIRGKLMNNSGWDSFILFTGAENVRQGLVGDEFKETLQYMLLTTYDIEFLEEKNIRYIYDFSDFMESNYNLYVGEDLYDNDLTLIKNDPTFFKKLMEKNPGEIVEVEENIYEIINTKDRIYGEGVTFEKISPVKYKIHISNLKEGIDLTFLESYHNGWMLYSAKSQYSNSNVQSNSRPEDDQPLADKFQLSKSLFNESHRETLDYANKWTVDPKEIRDNLDENYYKINSDGSIDVDLILYFKPQIYQNIGVILAIMTIVSSIMYLFYSKIVSRK